MHPINLKFIQHQKQAKDNINSDNNNNFIPTINANCSIIVDAIKDSMKGSINRIVIDNRKVKNNQIDIVE